jgi:hypothetical protein
LREVHHLQFSFGSLRAQHDVRPALSPTRSIN